MTMHWISRTTKRRPLSLLVRSRVRSRAVFVDIVDISEGGCKVRGTAGFAQVGDRMVMKIGGVNAPLGTVAWVDGRHAGIAFEGEMHTAVLDHLCANHEAAMQENLSNRHRYL